jgi:hypothetical protein
MLLIFKPLDTESLETLLFLSQEPKWIRSPFHLILSLCKPAVRTLYKTYFCGVNPYGVTLFSWHELETHARARAHKRTSQWRQFFPEKSTDIHPVENFFTSSQTRNFFLMLAEARPWSSFWASSIQASYLYHTESLTKLLPNISYVTLHLTSNMAMELRYERSLDHVNVTLLTQNNPTN